MIKKRSRAKYTEFVATKATPDTVATLNNIVDSELDKGRLGFTLSDLLREGLELVIAHYNPNGSRPTLDSETRGGSPIPGKSVSRMSSRTEAELPHAGDRDFLALTNAKALGSECDGEYIKEVKDGAKKYICSMWLDGRCLRPVRPPNCPKLAHITPKEVKASLTESAQETKGEDF